ncbi:MAG: imidazole glycerol phosphate synthase subunit HisH, partial [Candidatus Paceibacterota bacterium]
EDRGFIKPLRFYALEKKIPFIGICLGMQLLADRGNEGGETAGLGLISGQVKKLEPKSLSEKIPHIGWNDVNKTKENKIFEGIPNGSDFYFVHSYNLIPKDKKDILAVTPYCGGFVSVVGKDNIYGTQFHPEKSSRAGFQLLKNFLNM